MLRVRHTTHHLLCHLLQSFIKLGSETALDLNPISKFFTTLGLQEMVLGKKKLFAFPTNIVFRMKKTSLCYSKSPL